MLVIQQQLRGAARAFLRGTKGEWQFDVKQRRTRKEGT